MSDLTPSAMADRLCPESAGPIVRKLIEAICERAIEITPPARHQAGQALAVERNVMLAAHVLRQRQNERLENLLLALKGDGDEDDETEEP